MTEGMTILLEIPEDYVFTDEVWGEELVPSDRSHANQAAMYVEITGPGAVVEMRCGHPGFDCLPHACLDTGDMTTTKVVRHTGVYEVNLSGQCSVRPVLTAYQSGIVRVAGVLFKDK